MVTEKAYAKINLFLDVCALRSDGFHDLKTVMQRISLCDTLCLSAIPSDSTEISLCIKGAELPSDKGNLVYRAVSEYLSEAKIDARVCVTLEKNIPIAAGLAGGSSDAAAALRAINRELGAFGDAELLGIAARLGSDVPFCLVGGTTLCEGRGEIMTELPKLGTTHLVVAIGEDRISTPAAFARLDALFSRFDGSVVTGGEKRLESLLSSIENASFNIEGLFNIFETDIDKNAISVSKIKAEMLDMGASAAMMSGSGPSVFGIFTSPEETKKAARALCDLGYFAVPATTL